MAFQNGAATAGNGASSIQISDDVLAQIRPLLHDGETVQVAVETDMLLSGEFSSAWLVGTDSGIAVFSQNGAGLARKVSVPWEQTVGLYQRDGLGTGLLEARTLDGSVPLVRYTEARADPIEAAVERLKEMLPEPQEEEEEKGGEAADRARRLSAPAPLRSARTPRCRYQCPRARRC